MQQIATRSARHAQFGQQRRQGRRAPRPESRAIQPSPRLHHFGGLVACFGQSSPATNHCWPWGSSDDPDTRARSSHRRTQRHADAEKASPLDSEDPATVQRRRDSGVPGHAARTEGRAPERCPVVAAQAFCVALALTKPWALVEGFDSFAGRRRPPQPQNTIRECGP